VLADCGYRVDVRVLGKSGVGRVVILVDEAHDFSASVRTRDGAPVLSGTRRQEDRLIKNMGWHVVRIPWYLSRSPSFYRIVLCTSCCRTQRDVLCASRTSYYVLPPQV
jgi:hypothetical protein